ncbi:MAG: hypothetical protein ABW146_05295 [Candidatus Sedimenticola sp. 6PFRAG7]
MILPERLKFLMDFYGVSAPWIEKKTGVKAHQIRNAKSKNTRINQDIYDAVEKLWPEHSYWFMTGKTLPDCGQTSPVDEEVKEAQKRLDEAIKKQQSTSE